MTRIYRSAQGERAVLDRYRQFLDHWPAPRTELSVPTSQGHVFVVASGPEGAPALILLHGSSSNSSSWMGDVAAWAAEYRVYAIDMIGEPGLSAASRPALSSGKYGPWVDEVVRGLGLKQTSVVGLSLGGWLALDYATKFPGSVDGLVLLCPGGVGRQKAVLHWVLPLLLLGSWGQRRILARIVGKRPKPSSPAEQAFGDFSLLIARHFLPRLERLPILDNAALGRLTMPVMLIVGGRDVLIDSQDTRRRLQAATPHSEITFLPDAPHMLIGFTQPIFEFLSRVRRKRDA